VEFFFFLDLSFFVEPAIFISCKKKIINSLITYERIRIAFYFFTVNKMNHEQFHILRHVLLFALVIGLYFFINWKLSYYRKDKESYRLNGAVDCNKICLGTPDVAMSACIDNCKINNSNFQYTTRGDGMYDSRTAGKNGYITVNGEWIPYYSVRSNSWGYDGGV